MGKSRVFNRQLDPKLIGAKITRLRIEAGLGRKGLADAMGVAVTSVRAYEIGKVCPEYEHLLPIAQALGRTGTGKATAKKTFPEDAPSS